MARYVIVQFDDNDEADTFVAAVNSGVVLCSKGTAADYVMTELQPAKVKIKGMQAKPTLFCDCTNNPPTANSERYNWVVCLACKKAKRGTHHPWNLLDPMKEGETKIDYIHRRMYYIGVIEGYDANPLAHFKPPFENPNYVPLRSMKR